VQRLALFGMLCPPAVVAPLWYEALRNHSQVHAPFTYANVPATLGIILAAALFVATPLGRNAAPAGGKISTAALVANSPMNQNSLVRKNAKVSV